MKKLKILFLIIISPIIIFAQYSNIEQFKEFDSKPVINRNLKSSYLLNKYDQKFVLIDLSVTDTSSFISGSVKYKLLAKSNVDTLFFQFTTNITIDSVMINNVLCSYYYSNDTIFIFPNSTINQGAEFEPKIWYHGNPTSTGYLRGVNNTTDTIYHQTTTWTLSESFHLKDWLPCKQDLTDRFDSAWIFITVDTSLKAASNGMLSQITQLGNGKARYEWKEHHKIVYYLLSFAVSKYIEKNIYAHPSNSPDSILIQNFLYNNPQFLNDNAWNISQIVPVFELYCNKFGPYPWADEKFGHALCYVKGGMEHQTITSLGFLDTWLVAHELTHQWFGDHVTCASWQDIWVNEGFASYGEYIYAQNLVNQQTANDQMAYCHKRALLEPFKSVYVPFADINDENRIFDSKLSYKKGSAIIHMFRYLCNNDSLFYTALKQIQIQYSDSVITGYNVKQVFENVIGLNLNNFFDEWYYGEGFPIYNLIWNQDSLQSSWGDLSLNIQHHGSSTNNNLFTIPVEIKISYQNLTDTIVKLYPTQNNQNFNIITNGNKVVNIIFDPNNWVLDSLLSISQNVQITELNDFFILLGQNPSSNSINFQYFGGDNFNGTITVFDETGRKISENVINQNNFDIPISNISSGLCFVKVHGNHINTIKKIAIIR